MKTPAKFVCALVATCVVSSAGAEVPVKTTLRYLPASNGHGAALLDLKSARVTHFREHLFATEEPLLDAAGKELWSGNQPLAVPTRDLLFDAYFGLRRSGKQAWLTGDPVDLQKSGYANYTAGALGGTAVARMVQTRGPIVLTELLFCPAGLDHPGFVMALSVKNTGASAEPGVSVFSLHNFHLGFGRPGARAEIGENGETATFQGDLSERGFAGVVVARALTPASHHMGSYAAAPAAENPFTIVDAGSGDFSDLSGDAPAHDGTITGYQWNLGTLEPGAEQWVGVAFAHHGDPFARAEVQGWLDAWLNGRNLDQLIGGEIGKWKALQDSLVVPSGLAKEDEALYRHGAVMLSMAQVASDSAFLREWLGKDGDSRYTRFGAKLGSPPAKLPATIAHRGRGAILASLPPGEWTVSWIRDASYSIAALAGMGMNARAKDALDYYLGAEGGRFKDYSELKPYAMPPYRLSLVRYHGFGVEETDFSDFGPNLEFDGFGLFLWALRRYQLAAGDAAFVKAKWPLVKSEIADVLVALIEPETGLVRPDSSIWETHWNGRQRHWAFTSITAARGLCDAAELAKIAGDAAAETKFRAAGIALRKAIAERLTDHDGALASNTEELAAGSGYFDAAVLDAIALELFDPSGRIAKATIAAIDKSLKVPAGAGWARNDDRFDHSGSEDLSPWGSEYDSGEWLLCDMRGAVAASRMGDTARATRLTSWARDQALANYLEMAEVFDEGNGTYKFNSPMIGFGAGAYALALQARAAKSDPACGAYFAEPTTTTTMTTGARGGDAPAAAGAGSGCHCSSAGARTDVGGRGRLPLAASLLVVAIGAALVRRSVRV